jgi:hypothetical protein
MSASRAKAASWLAALGLVGVGALVVKRVRDAKVKKQALLTKQEAKEKSISPAEVKKGVACTWTTTSVSASNAKATETILSPFDTLELVISMAHSFIYEGVHLDEDKLQRSLAQALSHFPQLGGRVFRKNATNEIWVRHDAPAVDFAVTRVSGAIDLAFGQRSEQSAADTLALAGATVNAIFPAKFAPGEESPERLFRACLALVTDPASGRRRSLLTMWVNHGLLDGDSFHQ